jgi:FdhD protein
LLFSTGRVSSEIVSKAAQADIPAIVTRAAPTNMAVELAVEKNIILITGVKRDSFYIHNGIDRIR